MGCIYNALDSKFKDSKYLGEAKIIVEAVRRTALVTEKVAKCRDYHTENKEDASPVTSIDGY